MCVDAGLELTTGSKCIHQCDQRRQHDGLVDVTISLFAEHHRSLAHEFPVCPVVQRPGQVDPRGRRRDLRSVRAGLVQQPDAGGDSVGGLGETFGEQGGEHRLLVGEVVVERALADLDAADDVVDGHAVVAGGGEMPARGVQKVGTSLFCVHLTPGSHAGSLVRSRPLVSFCTVGRMAAHHTKRAR
ncbi:Uncharacterised protein [Mycobacteroides abscessus subsp. massiliense]|nr:Uncharacterised protein [Mycobacteroides abscessus subsp. massiliense]